MFTDNDNLKKSSGYISLDDMLKLAQDIAGKTVGYYLLTSVDINNKPKKKKRKKQESVR